MSALRGMAALLAGVGKGMVARKEDDEVKARQAKEDAWRDEQRDNQRAEIARNNADRQGMRDAGAERTTMQGTMVTDGSGNRGLYADPVQAARAAEEFKIEAEMREQPPERVTVQAATGITGNMAKGHQITTEPVDLKAINGPEARAGRFQAELERQGKPLDALNMSNAMMDNKAKTLGLEAAQLKHLNTTYNTSVLGKLKAPGGSVFENAAKLASDVQFGGFAGATARAEVSADGKTVSIIATKDGKDLPPRTYPNNATGQMQLTQQLLKVDEATQISYLKDSADREAAAAKADLEAERVKIAQQQANARDRQVDAMVLKLAGGGGGSRGGVGAVWDDKADAFLRDRYTTKSPDSGEVRVDGVGLQFGKTIALAVSQKNGGDHTSGLGFAFQKDGELRAAATDQKGNYDPSKHNQLRQQYLKAISGQGAEGPANPSPASGGAAAPAPAAPGDTAAATKPGLMTQMFGRGQANAPGVAQPAQAPYTPPAGSPAAKAAAARESARSNAMQQQVQRINSVAGAASAAIASRDPRAASAAQAMPGFGDLPRDQQAAIYRIVNGR